MIYNLRLLADALAENRSPSTIAGRGTGRTTAAVLGAISHAILSPGQQILVRDTSYCAGGHTVDALAHPNVRRYLVQAGNALVEKLALDEIKFFDNGGAVVCVSNWAVAL